LEVPKVAGASELGVERATGIRAGRLIICCSVEPHHDNLRVVGYSEIVHLKFSLRTVGQFEEQPHRALKFPTEIPLGAFRDRYWHGALKKAVRFKALVRLKSKWKF
jgi:hypothetical protein